MCSLGPVRWSWQWRWFRFGSVCLARRQDGQQTLQRNQSFTLMPSTSHTDGHKWPQIGTKLSRSLLPSGSGNSAGRLLGRLVDCHPLHGDQHDHQPTNGTITLTKIISGLLAFAKVHHNIPRSSDEVFYCYLICQKRLPYAVITTLGQDGGS